MPETTPLIKAALNLRVGAGFDVYNISAFIFQLLQFYDGEETDFTCNTYITLNDNAFEGVSISLREEKVYG